MSDFCLCFITCGQFSGHVGTSDPRGSAWCTGQLIFRCSSVDPCGFQASKKGILPVPVFNRNVTECKKGKSNQLLTFWVLNLNTQHHDLILWKEKEEHFQAAVINGDCRQSSIIRHVSIPTMNVIQVSHFPSSNNIFILLFKSICSELWIFRSKYQVYIERSPCTH